MLSTVLIFRVTWELLDFTVYWYLPHTAVVWLNNGTKCLSCNRYSVYVCNLATREKMFKESNTIFSYCQISLFKFYKFNLAGSKLCRFMVICVKRLVWAADTALQYKRLPVKEIVSLIPGTTNKQTNNFCSWLLHGQKYPITNRFIK